MNPPLTIDDERGVALVLTLLVVLVVGALVTGAAVVGSNHYLVSRYYDRESNLEAVADAGLELARARVNADKSLYPDSGYTVLESHATVENGDGQEIPGVTRSTYVGPTGLTSGQYGVFGSIVTVVQDEGGGRVVRRQQVYQESFAKFAYFTDSEGGNIYFGGGDQLWGPVHSNDEIKIHYTGATFHDDVTTHRNVRYPENGDFRQGYEEYVPAIPMPETQELQDLEQQARAGGTYFEGSTNGQPGSATTRIEFVAVDINGDGDRSDDNEGFIRVYQSADYPDWVVARSGDAPGNCQWWSACPVDTDMRVSENCGGYPDGDPDDDDWTVAGDLDEDDAETALTSAGRRCYLGGDEALNGGSFQANDAFGEWLQWTGSVASDVQNARPDDADYLFPINRTYNPDFKGVIFVDGKVAVSGELRGRVTVAASSEIILADDLTYVTDPGAGLCEDMLGFFSGDDVIVADNTTNSPREPWDGANAYYTYDDTKDEFFQGTVLALGQFFVMRYDQGATAAEPCEGTAWGRGCLYLTGGIIQTTRGPVGTTSGTGYLKRYSYDQCAAQRPPPYFPTTGVFARSTYYQVDPSGFDINEYWSDLTPN